MNRTLPATICRAVLGVALLAASVQAANWPATGSMGTARYLHTATLLPSGKVLVAGGAGGGNSSEVYDSAAGNWTVTGSLTAARAYATATLLPSGKVLVAGGFDGGYLSSAEVYDPATGNWSATSSMAATRASHTATLLPSGKVLVAGGFNTSSGFLSGAEVYDPATGAWTATGSLGTGRENHTATLLPSGKVLAVGGANGSGSLSSAEVYDPAMGNWTAINALATARADHTATLLPSGRVLVAGGLSTGGVYFSSAEVYEPATGTWTATGALATGRAYHTATLLPSGKVLVAGGYSGVSTLAGAEVHDPATGNWTATTGPMAAARRSHTAALLPSGKLLVAGGNNGGGNLSSAEVYDPATGNWTNTGSLATSRFLPTATLLPSGKVLVAGGLHSGPNASAEVYDPATGTWTTINSMNTARFYHTATLLPSGKVLVAGGVGGGGNLSSAEVYDPATGTWTATGSLATARYYHTATLLPSGKVLVAGGYNGGSLASAEVYDPATGNWTPAGPTGSMGTARYYHTATLLPSGKVLVAGGDNGAALSSAEVYDPATDTWTTINPMSTARYVLTATLLPSGKVLVAGGANSGGYLSSAEVYDPATGTWTNTGSLATARESHTATLLPSGKVLVAGGDNGAALSSAEVYGEDLGYSPLWQPSLAQATSPLSLGAPLTALGGQFNGLSEASGGSTNNSASNYPLVQLRSLANDQTAFLLPDPAKPWSNTSFTSKAVTGFPIGTAEVTVFVNGIPSQTQTISIVGPATALQVAGFPTPTVAGVAHQVTVSAKDGGTNTAVGYTGTVHFTSSDPQAVLPGDYTFTAADQGVQSFSVTLKTAGTQSITATDTAPTAIAGAQSGIVVNTGTADHLALQTQPSAQASVGQVFAQQPAVRIEDACGNLIAADNSTVVDAVLASGPGTLQGTTTASGGVATFTNLACNTAGTVSILFTSNPLIATISNSIIIDPLSQTITFGALTQKTYGDAPFTVSATGGASGNPVTFAIASGPAPATGTNGSTITITGAGLVTVRASQAGNTNYSAAPDVDQSFTVAKATQAIAFAALSGKTYGDAPFTVSATGGASGNPVTFAIASGPATATGTNGSTITITGAGLVTVRASQAGNTNYSAAADVDQSFTVAKASATVTLGSLKQTYDGTAKSATATTTPVGLTVDITYGGSTPAPSNPGSYTVVGAVNDANYQGSASGVLVINAVPTVTASASPASGPVALDVPFSANGADIGGDALSYSWNFGDGSAASTVQNPLHTYTAPGTYTATVTVSDGKGGTSTASVTVTVTAAGGQMAGSTDSDGDGFSDEIEAALGSSPNNASDTPGGAAKPTAAGKLSVSKLSIKLNFAKPQGNDSIGLSGLLLIPEGFSIGGQTAIVDIGGVVKSFTLDPKGTSPKGNDSMAVGVKASKTGTPLQVAKFVVKLSKGSFAAALADDGLTNETKTGKLTLPVSVIFYGSLQTKSVPQDYKATKDKSGATK
ncbi:MAG TPA: kelch repeat-containing protein [Planctomycetota bacterium]